MLKPDITSLRNAMRLIAAASSVVLATGAGSAFAQFDVSGGNDTTGSNSENENVVDIDDDIDFDFENSAWLDNWFSASVDTGSNSTEDNTTVDDVTTGDVDGVLIFDNHLNMSDDMDLGLDGLLEGSVDFENNRTGSSSENRNRLDVDRDVDIDIENSAGVENGVELRARTGNNSVEDNTTVGDVESGDINFDARVQNHLNGGSGSLDLGDLGGMSVDADFENDTTGSNSENENRVDVDSDIDVDVENNAEISNNVDLDADSGNNSTEDNTTVGDVSTGSVSFDVRILNEAN